MAYYIHQMCYTNLTKPIEVVYLSAHWLNAVNVTNGPT